MWKQWLNFFKQDLWFHPPKGSSSLRSSCLSLMRIVASAARGFVYDDCYLKASALTFYSLLSVVPVLAVAFGIAKGFGFQQRLENEILVQFHEQPEIAHKIIAFSYSLLEHAQGGIIAGIGAIGLFYTALKLLESIELSLNSIWRISSQRPWTRKFSDYLSVMIFCPFFFVVSSSITIYFTTLVVRVTRKIQILDLISPLIFFFLNLIPYIFSWLLFSFIYLFMPNTKVPWKVALTAGIVSGTAYQILQIVYIKFQIGVSSYGAIYGSFAALPLFLLWLNFSWLIVLAGAEVAYHMQRDLSNKSIAQYSKAHVLTSYRSIGIYLVTLAVHAFHEAKPPILLSKIGRSLGIPLALLQEIADNLSSKKILSEVKSAESDVFGYQPAQELSSLTLKCVLDALNSSNCKNIAVYQNKNLSALEQNISRYDQEINSLSVNIPLLELPIKEENFD